MSDRIDITIDGRPVSVERGAMLLDAIRDAGGEVPTLCHHPSLEPNGACRLCSVEITHADWKGWSGLVTSCLYPAEPGLQISTRSSDVKELRRTLLELYLSRCPEAEEVRALARSEGIETSSYPVREGADKCVLCGLCTRVCQDLGPAALAALGRGKGKAVGPRPDMVGEDCTCCGACALICPTGEIVQRRSDNAYTIWNREFQIPVCTINADRCRGCGLCEEVCPEGVPRVQLFKNGDVGATIVAEACTGCGICAGSCPTGAIEQEGAPLEVPSPTGSAAPGGTAQAGPTVYACSRSVFPASAGTINLVPCIGRVPIDRMLDDIAGGADGLLLVCRDQATCPHAKGGALGEVRARIAADIALLAGLGRSRIQYVLPAPGPEGPADALGQFTERLNANPINYIDASDAGTTTEMSPDIGRGMDHARQLMQWLNSRPELRPELPDSLASIFDQGDAGSACRKSGTVLYLGDLPLLDLLLSEVVGPWRLKELVEDAVRLLRQLEIDFVPALTVEAVRSIAPSRIVVFCETDLALFDNSCEKTTLDELAGGAPALQSSQSQSQSQSQSPPPGTGFPFHITQEERRAWLDELQSASDKLCCTTPHALAQLKLLGRQGTWLGRFSGEPCMAFSDSVRSDSRGEKV